MEKQTYTISNISCGQCVATIQSEIQDLDGVSAVEGNPDAKTITVEWQSPATTSQIKSKLSQIGYPASA